VAALREFRDRVPQGERLGHAPVGFTLSVYSHALPGIDRDAAHTIAGLILKEKTTRTRSVSNAVGKWAQKRPPGESPEGHSCS
jgi:hypothetical protein